MSSPEPGEVRVFISYSHDSAQHKKNVLQLSERLCTEGVDCNIDQYERSPPEGWPKWMNKQIDLANYVLIVCTENYEKRFKGQYETGKGRGVKWEGTIITQELYEAEAKNKRFIPVVFSPEDVDHIPIVLKGATYYTLDTDQGYDDLYAHLTDQRLILKPKLGKVRQLPLVEEEDLQKPITKAESLEKTKPSASPQYLDARFNVPYRQNYFFTGREDILVQLHDELKSNNAVALSQHIAICGLGGIGKTQTAIEYAYRYKDEYGSVLWVRGESIDSIVSDYVSIAKSLSLPVKGDSDQNLVVSAVMNWLRINENWLLIFDNADDPYLIEDFLPSKFQGHVLLTSRAQTFDNLGITNPIEIKKMMPEEAKNFLIRRTGYKNLDQSEISSLEELIGELDFLPLAMEQAGAYIHKLKCSFGEYLSSYRNHGLEVLEKSQVRSTEYPYSVATTWLLNFEQVEQISKASADILFVSAFLNCNNIPFDIFIKGAGELSENISSAINKVEVDSLVFKEVLEPLRQFSLISTYYDKNTFDIHRLVQAVLRGEMNETTQLLWAERVVKAVNRAFPEVEYKNWELCDKLLPQAQICSEHIKQWNLETEESAKLLNSTANYLYERVRFEECELFFNHALNIRNKILNPEHPDIAESLNNLAALYRFQGKYTDAEPLFIRSLKIREKVLGAEHPDVAISLNNLASLYKSQGKYSDAEPLYTRSLKIREKVLGAEHPDVATSLNNLATLFKSQGKYTDAEPLFIRSLKIREKVLESEHPAVATSLNNLAELYSSQGKYTDAEPLFIRSLKINEKVLGAEHPAVATSLNNVAKLYESQGKYTDAEPLFIRSLKINEKVLGAEHPDIATSLNNLAALYACQGKNLKAKELFVRSINIMEKSKGEDHPDYLTILENYANLLIKMKKGREASKILKRVEYIRAKNKNP